MGALKYAHPLFFFIVNNSLSLLGWVRGVNKAFINKKELSYTDHSHDLNNLSGILSITKGGTGVESLDELKQLLSIFNEYKIDGGSGNIPYSNAVKSSIITNIIAAVATYKSSIVGSGAQIYVSRIDGNRVTFDGYPAGFYWIAIGT